MYNTCWQYSLRPHLGQVCTFQYEFRTLHIETLQKDKANCKLKLFSSNPKFTFKIFLHLVSASIKVSGGKKDGVRLKPTHVGKITAA